MSLLSGPFVHVVHEAAHASGLIQIERTCWYGKVIYWYCLGWLSVCSELKRHFTIKEVSYA